MGKRFFSLDFEGSAIIELDDTVIEVVDEEWRKDLYDLKTPEEIAEMVGRCVVCHGWRLSSLDGWGDQPDSNAKVIVPPDWEVTYVREVKL